MILNVPLVLASASPRRKSLLEAMGLDPIVQPAEVDETPQPDETPTQMVERLALAKAQAVSPEYPDAIVLGSDTTVVLDGRILGKPESGDEARSMLRELSGREHEVITSLALVHESSDRQVVTSERTSVRFDTLSDRRIERYVAGGSPMDKAGSYGIQDDQGAYFVRGIRGDYYTVMGLPLNLLYRTAIATFPDLVTD